MDHANIQQFLLAFEAETVVDRPLTEVDFAGGGDLPSVFAVTDFAAASIATAARAADRLHRLIGGRARPITVDTRLASLWFQWSISPDGWKPAPTWDAIAGDYPTADGWIRLHTNAPHHRAAAQAVLGCEADREVVAAAVARWQADDLESAIVEAGGCAAAMRAESEWSSHPQGTAVAAEPIVSTTAGSVASPIGEDRAMIGGAPDRPLQGVRVLDLTRILAGPIATRFLAGLGADVLRIDPPDWEEPSVAPEVTLGKRCGRLDLRARDDQATFRRLLADADIIVHGYRPGALDGLGLSAPERQSLSPGLVDVSLCAYGWSGPWQGRRGFDSLVQMSSGIACAGMERTGADRPRPLPAQALDHATGYLMAANALHGWCDRLTDSKGSVTRLSLARTAAALCAGPRTDPESALAARSEADDEGHIEQTSWGPARRLRPPVDLTACRLSWDLPASDLGTEDAPLAWRDSFDSQNTAT